MTKNPRAIAREIPLHGMTFGLPRLAKSLIRQRVEAWVGLIFLVTGFAAQEAVYYGSHGSAGIVGRRQDAVGVAGLLIPLAVAFLIWRYVLPPIAERQWEKTWKLDHKGQPLEGDALAAAQRALGPGGNWDL